MLDLVRHTAVVGAETNPARHCEFARRQCKTLSVRRKEHTIRFGIQTLHLLVGVIVGNDFNVWVGKLSKWTATLYNQFYVSSFPKSANKRHDRVSKTFTMPTITNRDKSEDFFFLSFNVMESVTHTQRDHMNRYFDTRTLKNFFVPLARYDHSLTRIQRINPLKRDFVRFKHCGTNSTPIFGDSSIGVKIGWVS